jgi:homoserine O-acetyltransferase
VNAFELLRSHLGLHQVHTIIGASLGGQQALEWAVQKPDVFRHLIVMGTNAQHSPWGIAFNETQRMAIDQDPSWKTSTVNAGLAGMKTARAVALLSYRNYETYNRFQQEVDGKNDTKLDDYRPSSYQRYQGEKLGKRFDAYTYWVLSKAMDSQNLGRNRGGNVGALATIKAKSMIVGLKTDILFPVTEQKYLAEHINRSQYMELDSIFGHDGFLIETDQLAQLIIQFYT